MLLDDASSRPGAAARLFRGPVELVAARQAQEVRPALAHLRAGVARGLHAAGFIGYEAGYALEPKLAPLARPADEGAPPLLWFGLFGEVTTFASTDLPDLLPAASALPTAPRPLVTRAAYDRAFERAAELIAAGDIYQANLTFQAEVTLPSDPPAAYAALRGRAAAPHGALIATGEHWLLSFSPELFFTLSGAQVTTRPMKGTAARSPDPAGDAALARALREDPKQRAENLMIVDLLRNDLARLARPGSVRVPALFEVETYPTIHQMTSTVTATLRDGADAIDLLATIFPCGSVTGAPKIRAMEAIAAIETGPRGVYTGAIGAIAPDGRASFNVAIRTLVARAGEPVANLGLGSGIVADSRADEEWRECHAKAAFLRTGSSAA